MAIQLRLDHKEGIRLRQQCARQVQFTEGENGGIAKSGTEWAFEGADCQQDLDPKQRDMKGNLMPAGTYTVHITANLRNLVVEKPKGAPVELAFRNSSLRNQMRIRNQQLTETGKKDKTGKPIKEWTTVQQQYLPANEWGGVRVGEGLRSILEEMPT